MYMLELLNLKTNKKFLKLFYDKYLMKKFIKKVEKGKSLKVLSITMDESWVD